ncbi:MAG: hypothetical protein JXA13_16640 [Anaerolineales bacterium]|nr:hypothetical protein [Anaerolineales bacterium]
MNRATKTSVAVFGTIFGVSGMSHGFFETLQGNIPTKIGMIMAIGEAHKMWPHGDEPAFTLIPNFLITGIAAMLVGLAIILWSWYFVQRKHGAAVFLGLFVLLLLVGGGVAQILFFPWFWLVATRINKPLAWWRKILPGKIRKPLASLWPWALGISAALITCTLVIATTGFVPGAADPEVALSVMLSCLAGSAVLMPLVFIAGFAVDINENPGQPETPPS